MDFINNISDIENLNDDQLFDLLGDIDNSLLNENNKLSEEDEMTLDENIQINKNPHRSNDLTCTSCGNSDGIIDDMTNGIIVCTSCGNVIGDITDKTLESRNYDNNDGGSKASVNRCSGATNPFLPLSSLGTTIACSNRSKIKTLHLWSAMPYKERSLHQVLKEIQEKCRLASILKCIEDDAKILYKNISETTYTEGNNKGKPIIIRGKNRKSLIAACIFFACKRKGDTRSPKEIAKLFELKDTEITKGCKTFLKMRKSKNFDYNLNSSTPEHFVGRLCRGLHIKANYIEETLKIAKNTKNLMNINILLLTQN